jgi:transcriptional regulator with XRE-family HTH domain
MDTSTSAGRLIVVLEQLLKSKGLRYRNVAAHLQVSEGRVKRYLSGMGVSVHVFEQLAAMVDLDFLSLATLAQQQSMTAGGLSNAQRAVLSMWAVLTRDYSDPVPG